MATERDYSILYYTFGILSLAGGKLMQGLPNSIVAVDVETTGLHSSDRIVTLGAWRLNTAGLASDVLDFEFLHIIFDPGKKSHPKAEEVHGYSDWTLRHQEPFADYAETLNKFISSADIVIAHNASFDLEFIDREYRLLRQASPVCRRYCTMDNYRQSGLPGRASLNAICEEMGLRRIGKKHGALEDAWLALMVYYRLNGVAARHIQPFESVLKRGISTLPVNFREPPPLPDGSIPRRERKSNSGAPVNDSPKTSAAARAKLMKAIRPTAILLLEVARADQSLASEEIEILVTLARSTCERLDFRIDEETQFDVLAELLDIEITQNILTRSARAIYEDPIARDAFPKWLASIATSDGVISPEERGAIDKIKATFARILPKE